MEAREAAYWRAILRLESATSRADRDEAKRNLDAYLADTGMTDHRAEGTATVYEQGGRFVLRFEDDTDIQNGPDLFVWVLASDSYDGGEPAEFIDLGKLKGNIGNPQYDVPAGFDLSSGATAVVWCRAFSVSFGAATVAPA